MRKLSSVGKQILFNIPLLFLLQRVVYAQNLLKDWDPTGTGNGGCLVDGVPTLKCAEVVVSNILTISTGLIILILFIMFTVGAFSYLTSGGNPENLKKARGTIMYAIIGTILFVLSFLIIKTVDVLFLGGKGLLFKFEIAPESP